VAGCFEKKASPSEGSGVEIGTMLRYRLFTILLLATVLVFSSSEVWAQTIFRQIGISSSPSPVGSGARALGMGGAFIAVADDATAASWNPGGLIQLEKPEMSVVTDYTYKRAEFTSDERPEIDNTAEVDKFRLNYLSFTYPFQLYKNFVVSLNYQRLYDFDIDFRHQLDFSSAGVDLKQERDFNQDGYVGALGLAAAVEIIPQLSFGVTLNIWTEKLLWRNGWDAKFSETSVGSISGVSTTIDTEVKDKYSDFEGINFNLGLLWNINKYLTLGAVVRTPFTASARHDFNFKQVQTFGPPLDTTVTSEQKIKENVDIDMPLSYGLGLSCRLSDAFTLDLDISRTHWSDFILKDSEGNKFSPIDGRRKSESNVKDTTAVRFGGEYLFILEKLQMVVPLRAGFFYDPEPAEDDVKDFFGVSIGSGVAYKRLLFDAAYQLRWGKDVNTANLIATSEADVYQHTFIASVIYHF